MILALKVVIQNDGDFVDVILLYPYTLQSNRRRDATVDNICTGLSLRLLTCKFSSHHVDVMVNVGSKGRFISLLLHKISEVIRKFLREILS